MPVKNKFFSFLCTPEDLQSIKFLSDKLERSETDAVRYIVRVMAKQFQEARDTPTTLVSYPSINKIMDEAKVME